MELRRELNYQGITYSHKVEEILNDVWCDVDAFVSDPQLLKKLRADHSSSYSKEQLDMLYIDEKELRKRAKVALQKLENLK